MSRVYIARADDYQAATLHASLARAMRAFDVPIGRYVVAKANLVFADRRLAHSCYTRPEVVKCALDEVFARRPDAHVTFVGNSGAGMPSAIAAQRATGQAPEFQKRGYWELERMFPNRVRLEPTDEGRLAQFTLSLGPRMSLDARHDYRVDPGPHARFWRQITTSAALAEADTLIWFPKLKSNVLSHGLTGACKLGGIGLLLDEDRMNGHNFHNDRRIADMMEIARPDLIVTDGVEIAYGGNQMTEVGRPLGIVIVADNPVAHDVVACHLFGIDPHGVKHLKLTAERGWGPIELSDIDLQTEIPLEVLQERVRSFGHHGGIEVGQFGQKFRDETGWDFPLEIISGPPYEQAGSQGVLLDWLYFNYDDSRRRRLMARWPAAAAMAGTVDRLPRNKNATVYLIGQRACRQFEAMVKPLYTLKVPHWLWRIVRGPSAWQRYQRRDGGRGWAVYMDGDPPTHRDLILGFFIGSLGRMITPFMRPDLIFDSYVRMLGVQLRRRIRNRGPLRRIEADTIPRMRRYRPVTGARDERLRPTEA